MKKTRIALAAFSAVMSDTAFVSARKSADTPVGFEARLQGNLATNIVYTQTPADGIASSGPQQRVVGKVVFDATAIVAADSVSITCGFQPRYVCWENVTDRVKIEWYEGMAADSCIKTAANGTRTLEVTGGNGGITVATKGFSVLQNATLAAILASKTCNFLATT